MKSLYDHFVILEDFRDERGKKHKLVDIIVMSIYGILCGYSDFVNIADFLKLKEDYFIQLLDLKYATPSHDCLSRVFSLIPPNEFMDIFINWVEDIVKIKTNKVIHIDGKAIKSATNRIKKGNTPYIVSAFLGNIGISIGQVKVDTKSSEHTAIPKLLDLINIKDSVITIDAIGTQKKIIDKIIEKDGDYCLNVKNNQKELLDDIKTYFNYELKLKNTSNIIKQTHTTDKGHGRIERREYFLSTDASFIYDKQKWNSVKSVGLVRNYRCINSEVTVEDKYYILSKNTTIDDFVYYTRNHWSIENSLHWVLDVIFNEDHSTNKIKDSIINLSTVRKFVFNMIKLDNSFGEKVPFQRKITRYILDFNNIENLIFQVIPRI